MNQVSFSHINEIGQPNRPIESFKDGGEVKHNLGKAGGYLIGKRHSEGGIKAINKSTGQPLEMEGGEVVITRNAVSDDTKRMFEGEMLTNREILSRINQSGGGVSFEDGGEIMACGNQYNYGGQMMTDHDILQEMALGGELDEIEMDEFEYGGEVTDIKLKNKILLPINDVSSVYYVNMFEDPEKIQIFKFEPFARYSGRTVFRGLTTWEVDKFAKVGRLYYVTKKDLLLKIEKDSKKSMLIPDKEGTKDAYRRFTEILDNFFDLSYKEQIEDTEKARTNWVLTNAEFQKQVLEFFNEYEIYEPNFIFRSDVKKKIKRVSKEEKFNYGIESIKFGYISNSKVYSKKTIKNDGNNVIVSVINQLIKNEIGDDYVEDNSEARIRGYTVNLPLKIANIKTKNQTKKQLNIVYGSIYGGFSKKTENKVLNKKDYSQLLIFDNLKLIDSSLLLFGVLDSIVYYESRGIINYLDLIKNGDLDLNIPVSELDYCRIVGYLIGRFTFEYEFDIIPPIKNSDDEELMIDGVLKVLNFDDNEIDKYKKDPWYDVLKICVYYYRSFILTESNKAKRDVNIRINQNIQLGDKVEISEQEATKLNFNPFDENGELLRGEVVTILFNPSIKRPENPQGGLYGVSYFVQDEEGGLSGEWEAKDLVLLKKEEVTQTTSPQSEGKKPLKSKNKKPLGDKDGLNKNIYDLQYLISITSDFDFEVKMKLRQQLSEFQKLKDLIYATENSDSLIKSITPNYDGKYAVAMIQTMLNADSVELNPRPKLSSDVVDGFQPNGQPTKLDKFNYDLIQTEMFKEWFGDYTTAYDFKDLSGYDNMIPVSKVMTNGYEPLVVFQGLGKSFERERFDAFPTSYFAVNEKYAEWFATKKGKRNGTEGYVLPFFLNVRNPLDMTYFGIEKVKPQDFFDYLFVKTGQTAEQLGFDARFLQPNVPAMEIWAYLRNSPNAIESIRNQGVYDGFHFFENNPQASGDQYQTEVWTTFFPNQTKLASSQRSKMLYSANQGFLMAKGGLLKK